MPAPELLPKLIFSDISECRGAAIRDSLGRLTAIRSAVLDSSGKTGSLREAVDYVLEASNLSWSDLNQVVIVVSEASTIDAISLLQSVKAESDQSTNEQSRPNFQIKTMDRHEADALLTIASHEPRSDTLIVNLGLSRNELYSISLWHFNGQQMTRINLPSPYTLPGAMYLATQHAINQEGKDFSFYGWNYRDFPSSVSQNHELIEMLRNLIEEWLSYNDLNSTFQSSIETQEKNTISSYINELACWCYLWFQIDIIQTGLFAHLMYKRLVQVINSMIRCYVENYQAEQVLMGGEFTLSAELNSTLREQQDVPLEITAFPGGLSSFLGAAVSSGQSQLEPSGSFIPDVYLGKEYSTQEVLHALNQFKDQLIWERVAEASLMERVTQRLAQGEVVAWFSGRCEVGPRALGNRVLLASAAHPDAERRLNQAKGAPQNKPVPIALTEEFAPIFSDLKCSSFMSWMSNLMPDVLSRWPHLGKTNRPHIISANQNPKYHRLVTELGITTGLPAVFKSSLNISCTPPAENPAQFCSLMANPQFGATIGVIENFTVTKR